MSKIPDKIGKYSIVSLIATGGMGAVYKGVHPTLNRHVILKKLTLKGNSSISERFKREARIMMDFKNDYIVDVYDHFKEGNSYYIVQEFVDGIALDGLIKQQRYLPNDIALLVFLYACKALHYAHTKQVIHRDIKPANILLSKTGDIKLVDFGIAVSEEDSEEGLTREGMTLGTPSYMAPEQFQNTKNVDRRADIYSMGVTLYEMVSGKRPFPSNFTAESIILIQKGKYKSAKKINPKVSRFILKLIKKMMKAKPRKRFQSLEKVINLVQRYLKPKGQAQARERLVRIIRGEQVEYAPRKKKSFFKRLLVTLLVSALLGGGAGYYLYTQNYHYEWLFAGVYGAARISVKLANNLKPAGQDLPIHMELYTERADKIPDQKTIIIPLTENIQKASKTAGYYESKILYLKAGYYGAKVSIGNHLAWNSFFVEPRTVQKTNAQTREARLVELAVNTGSAIPVAVAFIIRDQLTGAELKEDVSVQFRANTKENWVNWGDEVKDRVLPGKAAFFKFAKEGYFTMSMNPGINAFQNTLELTVLLVPRPGEVTVSSDIKDLFFTLNKSAYYRAGDEEGRIKKLTPLAGKEQKLLLPPGKYLLSAKGNSRELAVETGKKIGVKITADANSGSVIFTIK